MRITLIHNPDAGSRAQPHSDEILKLIRGAGHLAYSQSSKEARWESVLEIPTDLVAVLGGDGIVGNVAKRMLGKQTPVAVLPAGTANNIAKTLGLAQHPHDRLIASWTAGRRVKFDVGTVSGLWGSTCFIEALGLGLFTDTMSWLNARNNIDLAHHDAAEKKLTSVWEMMSARLENYRAYSLNIRLDNQQLSGEYVLLEAMNIRYVGPNLCLAPGANSGDGLLDVVLVSERERGQLKQFLADHIVRKPNTAPLPVRRGRHLRIESDCLPFHIDDALTSNSGLSTPHVSSVIEATLTPSALEILTPEEK
ncbi:MAG: diacylglycerol/lipid kinase family protein [Chloroflexota bacterium]